MMTDDEFAALRDRATAIADDTDGDPSTLIDDGCDIIAGLLAAAEAARARVAWLEKRHALAQIVATFAIEEAAKRGRPDPQAQAEYDAAQAALEAHEAVEPKGGAA
jgi:hypothetical protein